MLYTKLTVEAMKLAEKYHRNQVNKNGIPYIFHVVAVAEDCKTEYAQCVSLLSIEQRNRLIQKYKEAKEILENY